MDGAIAIDVTLESNIENLLFTVPYSTKRRSIRFCIVDQFGKPVSGATVRDSFSDAHQASSIGELKADATGCVTAQAYSAAAYRVIGMLRSAADFRQTRISKSVSIPPAEEDREFLLVLEKSPFEIKPPKY
jgi:hypothetical protein